MFIRLPFVHGSIRGISPKMSGAIFAAFMCLSMSGVSLVFKVIFGVTASGGRKILAHTLGNYGGWKFVLLDRFVRCG